MKAEPGQRLNSQLLEPSAFAIWNIHLASRRRLIAWRGAGLVNVRFWPEADMGSSVPRVVNPSDATP